MKKIVSICAVCLFVCVAVAIRAQEMETKYFSLNLPDGWEEIKMPNQDAIPGVTKMFANKKANAAISVSCAESPENPRESAERIRAQMNKDGLKVGELEEKDGIYSYNFQKGPAKGWAYYGSNGNELAIVTVWANSSGAAKDFFAKFKPVDPSIFPKF